MSKEIDPTFKELIQENLKRMSDNTPDLNKMIGVEGREGEIHIDTQKTQLLPDKVQITDLKADELRYFTKYLIDAVMDPMSKRVTADHFHYWAWTGACIAYYRMHNEFNPEEVRDLYTMIHLALLRARSGPSEMARAGGSEIRGKPQISRPDETNLIEGPNVVVNSMNDNGDVSIRRVEHQCFRIAMIVGFSVLEGGIYNFYDRIEPTENGFKWNGGNKKTIDWKKSKNSLGPGEEKYSYKDLIQIWRSFDTNSWVTEKVLNDIDNLLRYDKDVLLKNHPNIRDAIRMEFQDGTHSLLNIIGEARNDTFHALSDTKSIAPIMITICCLLFWDNIDGESYNEAREHILRNETKDKPTMPDGPGSFYPP